MCGGSGCGWGRGCRGLGASDTNLFVKMPDFIFRHLSTDQTLDALQSKCI